MVKTPFANLLPWLQWNSMLAWQLAATVLLVARTSRTIAFRLFVLVCGLQAGERFFARMASLEAGQGQLSPNENCCKGPTKPCSLKMKSGDITRPCGIEIPSCYFTCAISVNALNKNKSEMWIGNGKSRCRRLEAKTSPARVSQFVSLATAVFLYGRLQSQVVHFLVTDHTFFYVLLHRVRILADILV